MGVVLELWIPSSLLRILFFFLKILPKVVLFQEVTLVWKSETTLVREKEGVKEPLTILMKTGWKHHIVLSLKGMSET